MGEEWLDCDRLDLTDPETFREVYGLLDLACRVRCGDDTGIAIIECLPLGTYRPYGIGV
jgi:hypothetical protein